MSDKDLVDYMDESDSHQVEYVDDPPQCDKCGRGVDYVVTDSDGTGPEVCGKCYFNPGWNNHEQI